MKEGFLDSKTGVPAEKELELINKQSRRNLSADEVFVFSVVLCDNEIDRDLERFSIDALYKLADLYVGKSGIFDHTMKGRDQLARVFWCRVEKHPERLTKSGEVYHQLKAKAYMPRTDRNADIILEIDAGIKREVSVGCAIKKMRCSVCGADLKQGNCGHTKGRSYGKGESKVLCHGILEEPTDAFEWSFVAVPAQAEAGVVKTYLPTNKKGEMTMKIPALVKALGGKDEVRLSAAESVALKDYLNELEGRAALAGEYTDELHRDILQLSAVACPDLPGDLVSALAGRMTVKEMKRYRTALRKQADEALPVRPQLAMKKEANFQKNTEFMI